MLISTSEWLADLLLKSCFCNGMVSDCLIIYYNFFNEIQKTKADLIPIGFLNTETKVANEVNVCFFFHQPVHYNDG